jgi:hypothetical protein
MKKLLIILLLWSTCQAQTVPNTTTFCFSDVTAVVGGTCLSDAFANAINSHFDPTYKGSKNSLSNFRNYNNFFTSVEWCGEFQRDDCEEGIGEIGQVCVDAGYATSWVSQDDANDQADQYLYGGFGQSFANENFGCISSCTRTGNNTATLYTSVNGTAINSFNVCVLADSFSYGTSSTGYSDTVTNIIYANSSLSDCTLFPDGIYVLAYLVEDVTVYIAVEIVSGVLSTYPC